MGQTGLPEGFPLRESIPRREQRSKAGIHGLLPKRRMMRFDELYGMTAQTKSPFRWKYAGILVGLKLVIVAVVLGLSRVGFHPDWFPHWG